MSRKTDILRKHRPPLLCALAYRLLPRAWGEGPVSGSSLPPTQKLLLSETAVKDVFLTVNPRPQPWTHTCTRAPGWAGVSARAHPCVPAFPMALGPAGEAVTAEPSVACPTSFRGVPTFSRGHAGLVTAE